MTSAKFRIIKGFDMIDYKNANKILEWIGQEILYAMQCRRGLNKSLTVGVRTPYFRPDGARPIKYFS